MSISATCAVCKSQPAKFRSGMCLKCGQKAATRRRYERMVQAASFPWEYNQFLFSLYTSYREGGKFDFSVIPATARIIELLTLRELEPLKSWNEVYKISDELGFGRASKNPRRGCPVVYLARLLQARGLIPASPKSYPIYLCYRAIPAEVKEHVRRYGEEVLFARHHLDVALRRLRIIRDFAVWHGGDFFASSRIPVYLKIISADHGVRGFGERVSALRALYEWAVDEGISENPLAVDLSNLRKACTRCRKPKPIPAGGNVCRRCDDDLRYLGYIESFWRRLEKAPEYNRHLFTLYLRYIRRHRVNGISWMETKKLVEILESTEIPKILAWRDVNSASRLYKNAMARPIRKGCPFIKIGHILAEIGVLAYREQDECSRLGHALTRLSHGFRPNVEAFAKSLIRRNRRPITAYQNVLILVYFETWLRKHFPNAKPLDIDAATAREYLSSLSIGSRDSRHGALKRFFSWCHYKGIRADNPFSEIMRRKIEPELAILPLEDLRRILAFVRAKETDPSQALLLTLSLFFAFGAKELRYSRFRPGEGFVIEVYQRPTSYAHPYPTRANTFRLPERPSWFANLTVRFHADWRRRYSHLSWPLDQPLIFPSPSGRFNRPMSSIIFFEQIAAATYAAVGHPITLDVLRCTAGHLHTHGADASLLTQLGWAEASAFRYTWVPRRYRA